MKITTNTFGLTYRNHNNNFTRRPYLGSVFDSVKEAREFASDNKRIARKNFKVARIILETI